MVNKNQTQEKILNLVIGLLLFAYLLTGIVWLWPVSENSQRIGEHEANTEFAQTENVKQILPFKFEKKFQAISDFGKLNESIDQFFEVQPISVSEAQEIIQYAFQTNTPLRFRGSGHNAAGMTLPGRTEILFSTRGLTHYRLEQEGTVTIGAGVTMWEVRDFVEQLGYFLPVFPDMQGPSLGGYISVGGIGVTSGEFGGFWNNVESITLINGKGDISNIKSSDEIFPWIFGSNGQLGLVVEAKLRLIKLDKKLLPYPLGKSGDVFEKQKRHTPVNDLLQPKDSQIFFFQYLFVTPNRVAEAKQDLQLLMDKYSQGFVYDELDQLLIKHKSLTAPLIFENQEDMVALGIRSLARFQEEHHRGVLKKYGDEFRKLAQRKGYKLYLQHDARFHTLDYRQYYGNQVYEQFYHYKKQNDPENILNPGSVFP